MNETPAWVLAIIEKHKVQVVEEIKAQAIALAVHDAIAKARPPREQPKADCIACDGDDACMCNLPAPEAGDV